MQLLPAIDLKHGAVVRLKQGDFDQVTDYPTTPLALARTYQRQGADCLHIVDLDGAREGAASNLDEIAGIVTDTGLSVQTGGGIRHSEDIRKRLQRGIRRVVVGSVAVEQPDKFIHWLDRFGPDRLIAALDVRRHEDGFYYPASRGWLKAGGRDLLATLDQLTGAGLIHVLCTDIERDGMLSGPNVGLYQELLERYPGLQLQASGGVSEITDISTLKNAGLAAVVTGKALLEGRFEVPAALEQCR